jgi:DNA-binding XRE family transcriptional regulator
MAYPEQVQQFLDAVSQRLGDLKITLDETQAGYWWINLWKKRHLAVEWRPNRGFGLTASKFPAYGEGPSEFFRSPDRAAQRVAQILAPASSPTGLASVRELYGVTQAQLARKLARGQPAISQIEKGRDSKFETLDAYIRGLGGHIEIRAVFPDAYLPLKLAKTRGFKHAATKPARLART